MSAKRSNNAIWKLLVPEGTAPKDQIEIVISRYADQIHDGSIKHELTQIHMAQLVPGIELDLYLRPFLSDGLLSFIREYLNEPNDASKFMISGADSCLFLSTEFSIFAITSGSAYRIIAEFVDYSFPFDTAKKLISNSFTAADMRDMTGSRISRSETYRRKYSIGRSEAMDTVWKKLVGRLDNKRLPDDSPLLDIVDLTKMPAVEVKSSFTLRQRLDLVEVCKLIACLEQLPEPSEEHRKELSFLDNLYPIKNEHELMESLTRIFIDNIRLAMLNDEHPDIDILDPYDVVAFLGGSSFKLGRTEISEDIPEIDDLIALLLDRPKLHLQDEAIFFSEFSSLWLSYHADSDSSSRPIRHKLLDFLHGQVELEGKTYFRIDRIWYRCLGDFLENLKIGFIDEVFESVNRALLRPAFDFLTWNGGKESDFNIRQADEDGFYFGDEVYARVDNGRVELFDLLKVEAENRRTYVIHVKKGFDLRMRDACSQIRISSDVIAADIKNGKKVLTNYYHNAWVKHKINSKIDEETFLSWFDYDIVFVVLCSTVNDFVVEDFVKGRLQSHIARREILITKNYFKGSDYTFKLAHTKYVT
ncbi:DUF6119 family protein [Nocardia brasiliensis]|uniref:DUF6119 family protein n=1 Tax=Nocardia brasiliensis TaxID=37326 RepID=UPI0024548AA7|nr:DUF6119 family protein [Nocardia brasiliensis]